MHIWGLHIVDLCIIAFFLLAILAVGVWVSRGVKHEADFYLGGRKLGRLLQFFLNFGNSTDSTGAVTTSTEVYRQGAGGMWIGFQTLFITPFFWFTQPWYRRSRVVTMADLFVDRFNSRALASAYAGFNILIALITLGMGNLAAFKVCGAMVVKDEKDYTQQDRQTVSDYKEFIQLRALRVAGQLPAGKVERFRILDDLNANRKLHSSISYFQDKDVPFYIAYSAIVAAYIALGGLRAAAITDALQGVLVLAMSVLLIPLGLRAIGGFSGLHASVPAFRFQLIGDPEVSEYTWYSILAITFASLVQIIGLVHNMSTGGSARDEDTARFGMISGGFTKRFVIIMWMFCGLLAIARFSGSSALSDPDEAWGRLSRELLFTGLVGIMLSGMLLGHMPSVGVSAVAVSALATRNLYEPLVPGRSPKHYLRFGQFAIAVVLGFGILCATAFSGVIQAATMMITFNTYFGAVVFLIFFWRRLTVSAIAIGLVIWLVAMGIVPWFMPKVESFRQNPALLIKTDERQAEVSAPASADDVAAGKAAHVGELIRKPQSILPRPLFFDAIAHKASDPKLPLEGSGRFNIEVWSLHLLGVQVRSFRPAGLLATRWLFDGLFPFVMLILLSLVTPRSAPERAAAFYAKLKTPVAPTPEEDKAEVEQSARQPNRFDNRKLFPGTNWEFKKWTRKDFVGFFGCWGIVGIILLFLYAVLHAGG